MPTCRKRLLVRELYRGTVLYDSGKITARKRMNNCGSIYAVFAWSSNNAGALIGDNIYATSVQGIGIRVKVWLNISGEYGRLQYPDSQVHYIGDVNYYLGKPSLFDYYNHLITPRRISCSWWPPAALSPATVNYRSATRWQRYRQR
jgi:hypothetical protein